MPVFFIPDLDFWECTGVLGALTYATRYLLVAFDRLPSQSPSHYWSGLFAAVLVMVSLYQSFNLAAALTQIFFVIVSVIGILGHSGNQNRYRIGVEDQSVAPRERPTI